MVFGVPKALEKPDVPDELAPEELPSLLYVAAAFVVVVCVVSVLHAQRKRITVHNNASKRIICFFILNLLIVRQ